MLEVGFTADSAPDLRLNQAILLYSAPHQSDHCFATVHPVSQTDTGPEIAEGELLSMAALQEVLAKLNRGAGLKDWVYVDPQVIAAGSTLQAWYTPSQTRFVHFSDDTKIESGYAKQPAMFWIRSLSRDKQGGAHDLLSVYCLAGEERPTPNTPLFESVHYNVWAPGRVCQGSMVKTGFEDRSACMESFWQSRFTHRNDARAWTQTLHPKGLKCLWQDLIQAGGEAPFPVQMLKPLLDRDGAQLTVADVLLSIGGAHDD